MGARGGWTWLSSSTSLPWVCDDRGHEVIALIPKLSERHATYLLSGNSNGTLRTRQALDQNKASIRLSATRLGEGWKLMIFTRACGGGVCEGMFVYECESRDQYVWMSVCELGVWWIVNTLRTENISLFLITVMFFKWNFCCCRVKTFISKNKNSLLFWMNIKVIQVYCGQVNLPLKIKYTNHQKQVVFMPPKMQKQQLCLHNCMLFTWLCMFKARLNALNIFKG